MLPDRVSNPGPLTYESGALPIALRGPAPLKEEISPTIDWILLLTAIHYHPSDMTEILVKGHEIAIIPITVDQLLEEEFVVLGASSQRAFGVKMTLD